MNTQENAFSFFENNIHPLTPFIAEELGDMVDEHGEEWVMTAMRIAAMNGKRNMRYINSILERWRTEGYGSLPPWERRKQEEEERTNNVPSASEAWGEVLKAPITGFVQKVKKVEGEWQIHNYKYEWTHPLIEKVARQMGWPKSFLENTRMADRSRFMNAYQEELRNMK